MPYKDKTSPEAKASMARRNKTYYEKNKEYILEYKRLPKFDEYKRQYYKKNKEKMLKQNTVARRIRMFGIDEEMYNKMLVEQDNSCAICGVKQEELNHSLCVDHDHETGKVRGLLCHGCNNGIGKMKDNIETLKNAIKYLSI